MNRNALSPIPEQHVPGHLYTVEEVKAYVNRKIDERLAQRDDELLEKLLRFIGLMRRSVGVVRNKSDQQIDCHAEIWELTEHVERLELACKDALGGRRRA